MDILGTGKFLNMLQGLGADAFAGMVRMQINSYFSSTVIGFPFMEPGQQNIAADNLTVKNYKSLVPGVIKKTISAISSRVGGTI